MRELNVVISGFDHYDGVEVNPAVEVPKAIAEQGLGVSSAPDDPLEQVAVTVHAVSIPVSFAKAWPTLKETIEATKPNIVIATGLKHATYKSTGFYSILTLFYLATACSCRRC